MRLIAVVELPGKHLSSKTAWLLIMTFEHIGKAAKNAKVRDVWLLPFPMVIRCISIQSRSGSPVPHMHIGGNSITPEGGRELRLNQECSSTSSNIFIRTFCNSILVWFIMLR